MTDKTAYVRVLVPAVLYRAAKKAAHTRFEQVETLIPKLLEQYIAQVNETDAK